MGGNLSRVTYGLKDHVEEIVPSTPVLTPPFRKLDLDPRSPTANISRTPIEVLRTPLNKEIASSYSSINADDSELSNAVDIDPRSPTVDFHRTPLIVKGETYKDPKNIHNKILDNARRPPIFLTPSNTSLQPRQDIQDDTSPKLLETNTKYVKQVENKRHSFIGLLETNIDYIETDIDTAMQMKTVPKAVDDDVDLAVEAEFVDTPILESAQEVVTKENLSNVPDEIIDTITETTEAVTDITKCINEIDRKLTNLIYEDTDINKTPKTNRLADGHRTPLGDRNSNNQQKRLVPVLKVSDKPTKLPNISKIPVRKEKKLKGAFVQCENTPPRVIKRSHWGKEDSLII